MNQPPDSLRAMKIRQLFAALAAAALLGLAGCGDDDDSASDSGTTSAETETTETTAGEGASDISTNTSEKPEIVVPEGEPPSGLEIEDIVEGDGQTVEPGDTVTAHYVGVSYSNGEQFDSSWESGQPATFPLDGVIPGWQEGIPGMKVGGRRKLVIPPDLGYGEQGFPPDIGPNETLIFVVDLVGVQ